MSRGPPKQGAPYTRHEVIGRGSYGIVYKGVHNETRTTVAIKVLNLDTAEDEVSDIQKEIVLLQSLKSGDAQNVVRYHGSFLNGTRLWIIMDYCEGGSIRTLMKCGRIEEKFITIIIREVLAALNYIHRADIIHRDVKAANILVTNDGRVQLCDFGVAAQLAANHFKRNTFVGTPYWMAPEVISDGLSYNFKADIWSLGITVYEIATGNPPYADQEPMRAIFLIPRSTPPRLDGNLFSTHLKEFVAACLCEKPEDRPAAAELLKTKSMKNSAKVPTLILRELIARYEAWRKSGGVRKSLAMGGDLDVDDEFDGQFGLEDDSNNGQDGWDFGTARRSFMPVSDVQPTWEQSADATEDLLKTIRPATQVQSQTQSSERQGNDGGSHMVGNGSSSGSRYDNHPLLKLFGGQAQNLSGHTDLTTQSMTDLSSTRNGYLQSGTVISANSEPGTPLSEIVSIEMPAVNATSLTSSSSISLPVLSSTPSISRAGHREGPTMVNPRTRRPIGLTPSRQNSQDHFGGMAVRSATQIEHVLPPLSLPLDTRISFPGKVDGSLDSVTQTVVRTAEPSFETNTTASSPTRSRPSSPGRVPMINPMSPPSSPSRSTQTYSHSATASASSIGPILPKTGFNASLNQQHLNGSTQSLPDVLPRPPIGGPSRERSASSSAVPQISKHVKKPSNLVLQLPGLLDLPGNTCLPPSPSRLLTTGSSNPGYHPINQVYAPMLQPTSTVTMDPLKSSTKISSRKPLTDLPPLKALDLGVLTSNDQESAIKELSRVVEDMLVQLTHIEEGLTAI